ncbi:MAG: DUF6138 family protein [Tannerella sp.]|jgi:hypothetical protein|nr:DUF6138 family protein [Tannerella sp.]
MHTDIKILTDEIIVLIEKVFDHTAKRFNGTAEEIVKRSTLQMGLVDELGLTYTKNVIKVETTNSSLKENSSVSMILTKKEAEEELIPLLCGRLLEIVKKYDDDPFMNIRFRAGLKLTLSDVEDETDYIILDYVSESKRKRLKENMDTYIETKVLSGKYPTKPLDTHFLRDHLLDKALFGALEVPRIIRIFDRIQELNKNNPNLFKEHIHNIIYGLNQWAENDFLPIYCEREKSSWKSVLFSLDGDYKITGLKPDAKISPEDISLIDLLIYTSILILKYEPNYSRGTGLDYLNYAAGLGFGKAKDILKTGSGLFAKEDIVYKDKGVECLANDVFAIFTIKIKEEEPGSYGRALDFIINLLKKGFPASYSIKLSSKVKNFLPVKHLGKSKTHQFFANAWQYAELWDKLEEYARIAIKEFEWYEDVEAEECAMPGTYAVFGLALSDKKYFPLLDHYLNVVDDEHQSVQTNFAKPFVEKWGIDSDTISLFIKCLMTGQGNETLKLGTFFQHVDHLKILAKEVAGMAKHDVAYVTYAIWGQKPEVEKSAKKAGMDLKPYFEIILNKLS